MRYRKQLDSGMVKSALLVGFLAIVPTKVHAQSFDVVEASIADIHAAMRAGDLTARQLVQSYLDRIEAYDKQGPALNAIITINPRALERADELDRAFRTGGFVAPLHGIPIIVKDNYDTHDLQTTRAPHRSRGRFHLTMRFRSGASARPAPSSSRSRTWPSSRSHRMRPWARCSLGTRATHTPSIA